MFESEVEVEAGDQIITLSTCGPATAGKDGRLVVHGKLVKVG
ncbi:sortase [Shouchella patagoniensis]|nr:sortase [Shouchella patagoniensis]